MLIHPPWAGSTVVMMRVIHLAVPGGPSSKWRLHCKLEIERRMHTDTFDSTDSFLAKYDIAPAITLK